MYIKQFIYFSQSVVLKLEVSIIDAPSTGQKPSEIDAVLLPSVLGDNIDTIMDHFFLLNHRE